LKLVSKWRRTTNGVNEVYDLGREFYGNRHGNVVFEVIERGSRDRNRHCHLLSSVVEIDEEGNVVIPDARTDREYVEYANEQAGLRGAAAMASEQLKSVASVRIPGPTIVRIQPRIKCNMFVVTNEARDEILGIYANAYEADKECPDDYGVMKVSVSEIEGYGFHTAGILRNKP
jgi:hypothetical protein